MTVDVDEPRPSDAVAVEPPRHTPLWALLSTWLLALEAWLRSHGGTPLRAGIRGFWALVAGIGIFLLVGPVINAPLSFDDITSSAEDATGTWIARDFSADYEIVREDDGRLRLAVEERFTAFFPEDVDESSIDRVIATQYEGHDLSPVLRSASLDGAPVEPEVRRQPTRTTYAIRGDGRLTGEHDVVLRYDLNDVAYDDRDLSSEQPYQVLQWDLFGPEWSHAVAGSELRISVPRDIAASYARAPTGGIAWLLLSDSTTLEADDPDADTLVYELTNDQNFPPHASFWFTFRFAPDTFAMPAPSPLFFVQAFGPFVPLALLLLSVPFALAARAVAWADARGRAWFVAEYAPRPGSTVALDARLWRARRTSVLAEALEQWRQNPGDTRRERALVRAARRAGRWGDLPRALGAYRFSRAWGEQFRLGLRRVPRGFVRDGFLWGTAALTALQWGLVRQLSHQTALTVFWYPVAIVAVSTVLAAVVFTIALTARPLTAEGARAEEHLRGQRMYLENTDAAERTPLRDRDLPYIVLFERPRRAGRLVRRLLVEDGADGRVAADPDFVGAGRLAVRALALLTVAAAIVLASTTVATTRHAPGQDEILDDVDGDYGVYVDDADIEATLARAEDGTAELRVVETLSATVDANLRAVPQVTRAWRDVIDGHDQGLRVDSITVDGDEVPFVQTRRLGHAVVQTRLPDDWPGEHAIVVRYVLSVPVASIDSPDGAVDELRWTALLPYWDWTWDGVDHETERLRVALRLSPDLAGRLTDGSGWMTELAHRPGRPPAPFGDTLSRDGDVVIAFDEDVDDEYEPDSLWPSGTQYGGLQLRFADGTFAAPHAPDAAHRLWQALPWTLSPVLGGLAPVLAAVGVLAGRERLRRRGTAWDAVRWLPVAFTVAQVPLVAWASADAYDDDPILWVVLVPLAVSAVATVVVLVATRRRKSGDAPARRGRTPRRAKR